MFCSYSPAAEILEYFKHIATKYDLRKYVKFEHQVTLAVWDDDKGDWNLKIKDLRSGAETEDYCHFFINASGFLKLVNPSLYY
jgi:cation diffusion facilitator CzcD-associated flavoprotein CzcO